jgi:hypothetical protein
MAFQENQSEARYTSITGYWNKLMLLIILEAT